MYIYCYIIGTDMQYQHCKGPYLKQAFPNIGYALFGYNILRGFPLTPGHDPGFTYPIFKADYTKGLLSADCRYFVPDGLVMVPDISCLISFSSTTAHTMYEYTNALGVYVSLDGAIGSAMVKLPSGVKNLMAGKIPSLWGASFSASVGYRRVSSSMSSEQSIFILSSAKCNYYFSKLVADKAPTFDDAFITWIHKLNKAGSNSEVYFDFFNTYGTHFPMEVTFGARLALEHKMTSRDYARLIGTGVDINLAASYYGKFSLSGNLGVSTSQQKTVQTFSETVKTTMIPVGATPPADGNVLAWASEVKDNPVPTAYKLTSIENLFTDKYMKTFSVDYDKIYKNIVNFKLGYCAFLRETGQIESCDSLVPGTLIENTRLDGQYRETAVSATSDCIDTCLKDTYCIAVTFCTSCSSTDSSYMTCYMFEERSETPLSIKTMEPNAVWQTTVFSEKLASAIRLSDVRILGISRNLEKEVISGLDRNRCRKVCVDDAYCTAVTFDENAAEDFKCKMYQKEMITGLKIDSGVDTYFFSTRVDPKNVTSGL